MSPVPQTLPRERILALLREQPARTAILCDIDGTLAPVVDRPEEAGVPTPTRQVLEALSDRFGLVACISGRQAVDARRMVGIDALTYIGNHGLERLAPGAASPEVDPGVKPLAARVRAFAYAHFDDRVRAAGVRLEDKDAIWAFHWRGAHRPRRRPRAARAGRRGGPGGRPRPALGAHGARDPPHGKRRQGHRGRRPPSPARRSVPRSTAATTRRTWTPSAGCARSRPRGRSSSAYASGWRHRKGPRRSPRRRTSSWTIPTSFRELLAQLAA